MRFNSGYNWFLGAPRRSQSRAKPSEASEGSGGRSLPGSGSVTVYTTESWRLPDPGVGSGRPCGARSPPPRSLLRLFFSLSRRLPRLWRGGAFAAASAGSSSRGCLPQEKTTRADLPAAEPGPRRKRSEIAETAPANCSSAFAWARAGPRMPDWGQALLLSAALLTAASAAEGER